MPDEATEAQVSRWNIPRESKQLAAALVAALGEMRNAECDREANFGKFNHRWATLGAVLNIVRPVLAAHKLGLGQYPLGSLLLNVVWHESGECMYWAYPLCINPKLPLAEQDMGSLLTYACRRAISAAFGIASEDDDDGRSGSEAQREAHAKSVPTGIAPQADDGGRQLALAKAALLVEAQKYRAGHKDGSELTDQAWLIALIRDTYKTDKLVDLKQVEEIRARIRNGWYNPMTGRLAADERIEAEKAAAAATANPDGK